MMCSVANYDKAETSVLFQNLFLELALLRALVDPRVVGCQLLMCVTNHSCASTHARLGDCS